MNSQQILAQQGIHIDDPVIISAIENKAIIIILQGQSVNASNGNTQINCNFEGAIDKLLNDGLTRSQIIEQIDRVLIAKTLERTKHNYSAASRLLGISNNSIHQKAKQLGMK